MSLRVTWAGLNWSQLGVLMHLWSQVVGGRLVENAALLSVPLTSFQQASPGVFSWWKAQVPGGNAQVFFQTLLKPRLLLSRWPKQVTCLSWDSWEVWGVTTPQPGEWLTHSSTEPSPGPSAVRDTGGIWSTWPWKPGRRESNFWVGYRWLQPPLQWAQPRG